MSLKAGVTKKMSDWTDLELGMLLREATAELQTAQLKLQKVSEEIDRRGQLLNKIFKAPGAIKKNPLKKAK